MHLISISCVAVLVIDSIFHVVFLTASQFWHHLLNKIFWQIKCYSDRPYLFFLSAWNLKHTYISFLALLCYMSILIWQEVLIFKTMELRNSTFNMMWWTEQLLTAKLLFISNKRSKNELILLYYIFIGILQMNSGIKNFLSLNFRFDVSLFGFRCCFFVVAPKFRKPICCMFTFNLTLMAMYNQTKH